MIIGFTIGVWDCLHSGHINHLDQALEGCDLLIVGVVSDWLTRMQKSPDAPLYPYEERVARIIDRYTDQVKEGKLKLVHIDRLHLPPELLEVIDVAFAGPDQLDKFYAHPDNQTLMIKVVERTPGISSTQLRAATQTNQLN